MTKHISYGLNFRNPLILGLITFTVITIFQIYKNYYKNKKDKDDYQKPKIYKLLKPSVIAAILTWLISNYLFESIEDSETINEPTVFKAINNNIDLDNNNNNNDKISSERLLQNIYLDQPDF